MHKIIGVDHVGIGIRDMATMKSFYQNVLEFTRLFGEMPEADHPPIQPLLRVPKAVHSGIQIQQEAGGESVAMFHHVIPPPRPIRKDFKFGDIGVNKITIAVASIEQLVKDLKGKINFISNPKQITIPGWGKYSFIYAKDPEGNLIEFVSDPRFPVKGRFGGVLWISISVTELERSKEFYQKYLGFDKVFIKEHNAFSKSISDVFGFSKEMRSCVIENSNSSTKIELFEVNKHRGRSIPFAAQDCDFGYVKFCLIGDNMQEIEQYYKAEGMEVIMEPQYIDDPEVAGLSFMYIRDVDGVPIETMVLPPAKK
jgi:catechol 2,3-dioxygenase-like lactoylglutathione lyase family enzyme